MVGGGISGALALHRLAKKGVDSILVDRRDIGYGSTSASTALLQYEIDTPLRVLETYVGLKKAQRAYEMGVESIKRIHKLAGPRCGFPDAQ